MQLENFATMAMACKIYGCCAVRGSNTRIARTFFLCPTDVTWKRRAARREVQCGPIANAVLHSLIIDSLFFTHIPTPLLIVVLVWISYFYQKETGPSVKSKPHKTKHCKKQTLFKPNCEKTKYCKKQTLMKKQTYICVIGLSNNSQDKRLFNHCNH